MNRRSFMRHLAAVGSGALLLPATAAAGSPDPVSSFAGRLQPVGRILEMEDYYVWCNSPIQDRDGSIHVFFSRWPKQKGMGGWINGSEVCHALAAHPEGPYAFQQVVLAPRPGFFDATTCHNPSVKWIDGRYCLLYMGSSNGKTNSKRIGLAFSTSLYGPWQRSDYPLLEAGPAGAWDEHCTTNPALIRHPNAQYWLYYKSWNTAAYEKDTGPVRGNRRYGLAIADQLEGPYRKWTGNPVIDFSGRGNNAQLEDAFVWQEAGKYRLLARDMGWYNHEDGIILESDDGLRWKDPEIAYYGATHYNIPQPPAPPHLKKYGRFERPQILFLNGKPAYLFTAAQGGRYQTASSFLFRIT